MVPDSEKPSGRNSIALGLTHGHSFENGFGTKIAAVYLMENTHPIHTDCYVGDVVAGSGKENEEGYVATSKSIKRDLNL
ncbi:MAG: hypothetical protein LBE97_01720, partial [Holosporales bacterium]|nr:hypothetical protein [Holosporales bacterium]